VEEAPNRLAKVISTCHKVRYAADAQKKELDPNSPAFALKKAAVLLCERELLYTIEFDVQVDNPIMPFIDLVKRFSEARVIDDADKQNFSQIAMNFIGDSMRTNLCLQHDTKKIASACVFLTFVYLRKLPPKSDKARLHSLFGILSISERSLNCEHASLARGSRRCF